MTIIRDPALCHMVSCYFSSEAEKVVYEAQFSVLRIAWHASQEVRDHYRGKAIHTLFRRLVNKIANPPRLPDPTCVNNLLELEDNYWADSPIETEVRDLLLNKTISDSVVLEVLATVGTIQ